METLQATHVLLNNVVPDGHTQVPAEKINGLTQSQVLLFKVRLLIQAEHTFSDEQVKQLLALHPTQAPFNSVVPGGQAHTPPTIANGGLHPHVVRTKLFTQVPQ